MPAKNHIKQVLESAKKPLTLYQIQAEIKKRFRATYETTAISARIRGDVRPALETAGKTILSQRVKGKCVHAYWLARMPKQRGGFKA